MSNYQTLTQERKIQENAYKVAIQHLAMQKWSHPEAVQYLRKEYKRGHEIQLMFEALSAGAII